MHVAAQYPLLSFRPKHALSFFDHVELTLTTRRFESCIACTASQPAGPSCSTGSVSEVGTSFEPAQIEVVLNDQVVWTNRSTQTHTVTFDNFSSLSDVALDAGGSWEVKFSAAGTYAYHCTIHAAMTGTIIVS